MSSAVPQHCPYLGLEGDPHSIELAATEAHCCYAAGGPESIALQYQERYCLSREHPTCPLYRRAKGTPAPLQKTVVAPPVTSAPHTEQEPEELSKSPAWLDRIVLVVTVGALLFAVVYFGALFFDRTPAPSDIRSAPGATRTPAPTPRGTATPSVTATPRPVVATASDVSVPPPALTPPPGGKLSAINPALDGGGWVASNERAGNHLGDAVIRAGVFDKTIYFGLLQFDLSGIPAGAKGVYATLELTGARADHFAGNGAWQVKLVNLPPGKKWASLTFDDVRDLQWDFVLAPGLRGEQLGEGRANRLEFSGPTLAALERQFGQGRLTVRIEGPLTGADDLFAWESGLAGSNAAVRPVLYVGTQGGSDPGRSMVVIPCVPTPSDARTRGALAATATYVADVFGTPTPYPPNYATPVIVTATPTPDTIFVAATRSAGATEQATRIGTATVTPVNWVVAAVVTATPLPANSATATYQAAFATAIAATTGTPTPLPCHVSVTTSTPTPMVMYNEPTLTPTPLPTATPDAIPEVLRGKIMFMSDRDGAPSVFVMEPDGGHVGHLTSRWAYDYAAQRQAFSGGLQLAVVGNPGVSTRILLVEAGNPLARSVVENAAINYDPAWAPDGYWFAYVSTLLGHDEIYVTNRDGAEPRPLTTSVWEWNKRPSFSPDGNRIIWWSNRVTGRKQIWIMNVDGSQQSNLSSNGGNDWDPVWMR